MEFNTVIILIAQAVIAIILGLVIKSFLPTYFSKKGENLATKEDIEEITEKIEAVRVEYAQREHRSETAFNKEFEILFEAWDALFELRMATLSLRQPEFVIGIETLSDGEQMIEKLTIFGEKYTVFAKMVNRNEPFYPINIFSQFEEIRKLARKEADDTRYLGMFGDGTPEYWSRASENREEIISSINSACSLIRDRYSS